MRTESVLRLSVYEGIAYLLEIPLGKYIDGRMVSVSDILTYSNSDLDIVLNYIALFVSIVLVALLLSSFQSSWLKYAWVLILVGLFAFQVGIVCISQQDAAHIILFRLYFVYLKAALACQ